MPQTCPQCQSQVADDAGFCPSCGAALSASSTATQAAPPASAPARGAAPANAASSGSSVPAYKFDAARWSLADRIAGIASAVLFISLFLDWFSASFGPFSGSESGLSAHWYLYFVLILCVLIVAYLVLRAGWDELPIDMKFPHLTIMMVATLVNLVLVFIGFIFKPGAGSFSVVHINVGWSFGAFLALIAAIVAAAPYAVPQLRAKTMG